MSAASPELADGVAMPFCWLKATHDCSLTCEAVLPAASPATANAQTLFFFPLEASHVCSQSVTRLSPSVCLGCMCTHVCMHVCYLLIDCRRMFVPGKSRTFTALRRSSPQGEAPTSLSWQVLLKHMLTQEIGWRMIGSASIGTSVAFATKTPLDWTECAVCKSHVGWNLTNITHRCIFLCIYMSGLGRS